MAVFTAKSQTAGTKLSTKFFGDLLLKDLACFTLVRPMPGLEHTRQFALLERPETYPYVWFQSLEEREVCFPAVSLKKLLPDYQFQWMAHEQETLGVKEETPELYGIVCWLPKRKTINLAAPLALLRKEKRALQAINAVEGYPLDQPLHNAGDGHAGA